MENKKKEIVFDNYKATFDLDKVNIIDGYIAFLVGIEKDSGLFEVFTSILDEDLNFVIPLRKEIVSKVVMENEDYSNHAILFKNKRCFYLDKKSCYLVDLSDVKFTKQDDLYIPDKYIIKCDGIYDIGNGKVIVYNDNKKCYIYDVDNNYVSSNYYDAIVPSKEHDGMYDAYLFFKDKDNFEIQTKLLIDDEFDVDNEVEINGVINSYLPSCVLADNELLKNELIESYNYSNYLLKEDDKKLCKKIRH